MQLVKARKKHVEKIQHLTSRYGMSMPATAVNGTDVAIAAVDKGEVIGFLWIGLVADRNMGLVDFFTVDERYSKKGVGHQMAQKALRILKKKGVETVQGFIANDRYHNNSAFNALKMTMASDGHTYTRVYGHVERAVKELN